jgi:hypothetical protein
VIVKEVGFGLRHNRESSEALGGLVDVLDYAVDCLGLSEDVAGDIIVPSWIDRSISRPMEA